jgi:hypothetical protein
MSTLYDLEEALPHSSVLVGYDQDGFTYYETVCLPEVPCEPGQRPAGDQGLYMSNEKLLDAVQSQAEMFEYPWQYSLSIFEQVPLANDLGPVWRRNGQALIGRAKYGPRQGADVIDNLAATIEKRGQKLDVSRIRPGLEMAAFVRRENALYLRKAFPGEPDLEQAASLFMRASSSYQSVLEALHDISDQIVAQQMAAWLHSAAAAERDAGKLLLQRSEGTAQ